MFLKLYAIALTVFFVIDMVWLGLVAKDFYRGQIGSLMKTDFNWTAATLFYLLFIGGAYLLRHRTGRREEILDGCPAHRGALRFHDLCDL